MNTTSQIIEWKTNAWKDPAMVAWYSGRMVENTGTDQLKSRLEVDMFLSQTIGDRILDVGIGTGRGSLPLAARGMSVTGVDSSLAMLNECARLAHGLGLDPTLLQAPADRLPFPGDSFDSLVSLNVLVHFPNWRQILPEWARVVRTGGRLVFDVHSLDNCRAALGRDVTEEELTRIAPANYILRISAEDLVAECDKHGLAIVAMMPYGAFLGGGNRNHLLGTLEDKHYWSRLLSWLASDESLFEFALFLEQELVSRLTTTVTGRFMAVLEKRAGRQGNRAWVEQNRTLEEGLTRAPMDLDLVAARFAQPLEALRERLGGMLGRAGHSRRLLELLVEPLVAGGRLRWSDVVAAPWVDYFVGLSGKRQADAIAHATSMRLPHTGAGVNRAFESSGVSLGDGLEYLLVERILTRGLGLFTGTRS